MPMELGSDESNLKKVVLKALGDNVNSFYLANNKIIKQANDLLVYYHKIISTCKDTMSSQDKYFANIAPETQGYIEKIKNEPKLDELGLSRSLKMEEALKNLLKDSYPLALENFNTIQTMPDKLEKFIQQAKSLSPMSKTFDKDLADFEKIQKDINTTFKRMYNRDYNRKPVRGYIDVPNHICKYLSEVPLNRSLPNFINGILDSTGVLKVINPFGFICINNRRNSFVDNIYNADPHYIDPELEIAKQLRANNKEIIKYKDIAIKGGVSPDEVAGHLGDFNHGSRDEVLEFIKSPPSTKIRGAGILGRMQDMFKSRE